MHGAEKYTLLSGRIDVVSIFFSLVPPVASMSSKPTSPTDRPQQSPSVAQPLLVGAAARSTRGVGILRNPIRLPGQPLLRGPGLKVGSKIRTTEQE